MTKFADGLNDHLKDASIAQRGLGLPDERNDDADDLSKQLARQKHGTA
jgi:hypothetical protein